MDHGSLRSWSRDGALAGAITAAVGWAMSTGVIVGALTGSPRWDRLFAVSLATLAGATALGTLVWSAGWWLVGRSRALGLAAGPVAAALVSPVLALVSLAPFVPPHKIGSVPPEVWLLSAGFGAVAVGPPWVAYVAVRSRGRPGLPVVVASAAWILVPVGLMFAGLYTTGRL